MDTQNYNILEVLKTIFALLPTAVVFCVGTAIFKLGKIDIN